MAAWFAADRQGSVESVFDNSGAVLASATYDPFGNIVSGGVWSVTGYGFQGGSFDSATGLENFGGGGSGGGRWYDSVSMQWLREDPLGLTPDANPRRFVGNDPTNGTDPSGQVLIVSDGSADKWKEKAAASLGPDGGGVSAAQTTHSAFDRLLSRKGPTTVMWASDLAAARKRLSSLVDERDRLWDKALQNYEIHTEKFQDEVGKLVSAHRELYTDAFSKYKKALEGYAVAVKDQTPAGGASRRVYEEYFAKLREWDQLRQTNYARAYQVIREKYKSTIEEAETTYHTEMKEVTALNSKIRLLTALTTPEQFWFGSDEGDKLEFGIATSQNERIAAIPLTLADERLRDRRSEINPVAGSYEEAYWNAYKENPGLMTFGPDGLLWNSMPGNMLSGPSGSGRAFNIRSRGGRRPMAEQVRAGFESPIQGTASANAPEKAAVDNAAHNAAQFDQYKKSLAAQDTNSGKVGWVQDNPNMSPQAKAYEGGAPGARPGYAPTIERTLPDGAKKIVKFDGVEGEFLVDRKIAVTTFPKSKNQALRQSTALRENGLAGRWEVPNQAEAARAESMLKELGIQNIEVRVVP